MIYPLVNAMPQLLNDDDTGPILDDQSTFKPYIIIFSICVSAASILFVYCAIRLYKRSKKQQPAPKLKRVESLGFTGKELNELEKEMNYEQITLERNKSIK
eukprot:NODE_329_length_9526_cov_0.701708.p12 type:complete len:101 gc:universal NODE_329_length_9526_cov_0.701708:7941-8243(+)